MTSAIVLQTDFGMGISTNAMEGVINLVDPSIRIYHNTHDIPAFNTYVASVDLAYNIDYWPSGTIFVSVVDPGVGTSRRGVVAQLANGSFVVTPDNGTLTHMVHHPGVVEVRQIDETTNRLPGSEEVNIFHGRDVFAYTAARLASGAIGFSEVGPAYPVTEIITHPITPAAVCDDVITGMIESADAHFGLVSSNVPLQIFADEGIHYGDQVEVTITHQGRVTYHETVPYVPSFGSVEIGEPLLMNSEMKTIQIAVRERNLMVDHEIGSGPGWLIRFQRSEEPKGAVHHG